MDVSAANVKAACTALLDLMRAYNRCYGAINAALEPKPKLAALKKLDARLLPHFVALRDSYDRARAVFDDDLACEYRTARSQIEPISFRSRDWGKNLLTWAGQADKVPRERMYLPLPRGPEALRGNLQR